MWGKDAYTSGHDSLGKLAVLKTMSTIIDARVKLFRALGGLETHFKVREWPLQRNVALTRVFSWFSPGSVVENCFDHGQTLRKHVVLKI